MQLIFFLIQECVIRLIVKFTYYSQYFVDCIGSLLTVYANCIIFRFIFECQGIVVAIVYEMSELCF